MAQGAEHRTECWVFLFAGNMSFLLLRTNTFQKTCESVSEMCNMYYKGDRYNYVLPDKKTEVNQIISF